MKLYELSYDDFSCQIKKGQFQIDFGVVVFRFQSQLSSVISNIYKIYAEHEVVNHTFADYQVQVRQPSNLRKLIKPQVDFFADFHRPFAPLPKSQAYPLLEWGMNWCISSQEFNYLLLHAAVLEKNGKAIIFPAPPGSGKSTLTAYLAYSGWRLLSDEMTIIKLDTLEVVPFVRPICLKNNSIELVREWFPHIESTTTVRDTTKGNVAHFKPPKESVSSFTTAARIEAVVFPQFKSGSDFNIFQLTKAQTFQSLADNSFNHNVLGKVGFDTLVKLVENTQSLSIEYSDLIEVEKFLTEGQFS